MMVTTTNNTTTKLKAIVMPTCHCLWWRLTCLTFDKFCNEDQQQQQQLLLHARACVVADFYRRVACVACVWRRLQLAGRSSRKQQEGGRSSLELSYLPFLPLSCKENVDFVKDKISFVFHGSIFFFVHFFLCLLLGRNVLRRKYSFWKGGNVFCLVLNLFREDVMLWEI